MSSSDKGSVAERRSVLIGLGAATLFLPGCLRPMLAKGEAASDLRGQIELPRIDDRFGYHLSESLAERLGRVAHRFTGWRS